MALSTTAAQAQSAVYAWGLNHNGIFSGGAGGELGDGTKTNRPSPVQVHGVNDVGFLSGITNIGAGGSNSLAVGPGGALFSWGPTGGGILPEPVQGAGNSGALTGFTAVAGGANHSLALGPGGSVWAWGTNTAAQLGDGSLTNRSAPVQVHGENGVGFLTGVTSIAAGSTHSMAIGPGGGVWTWGQLSSTTLDADALKVDGLEGITSIAAGNGLALAVGAGGSVWSWNCSVPNPLGIYSGPVAVQVPGVGGSGFLTGVTSVASGNGFALAVGTDGSVYSWGANGQGELGDGTTATSVLPEAITALSGEDIVQVAAGYMSSYALSADGRLWSWGYNSVGQLGLGDTVQRLLPTEVHAPAGYRFDSIDADAGGEHVLALVSPVPEPGAALLLGISALAVGRRRSVQRSTESRR